MLGWRLINGSRHKIVNVHYVQPQVNPRVIREGNLHFDGDSPHLRPTCHDFNTSLKNLGHTTNPFF